MRGEISKLLFLRETVGGQKEVGGGGEGGGRGEGVAAC